MTIAQLLMRWDQVNMPPGFTVIYSNNGSPSPAPLQSLATALAPYVPPSFTLVVPNSGRLINEVDGKMTGVWSNGVQTSTVGTGTGTYAPASGGQIKWDTNEFKHGHRVQGLSYMVPLMSAQFTTTGVLLSTFCNTMQAAAAQMIVNMAQSFVIWSRPVFVKDADGKPTDVIDRPGSMHKVSTATVPNKSVVLRGRRDA